MKRRVAPGTGKTRTAKEHHLPGCYVTSRMIEDYSDYLIKMNDFNNLKEINRPWINK
ncbi:hypothetical protein J2Z49_000577 [Desulfofundulus luciae]|uniref:Uncharacterized protein n=1 Tax=Desulfofundulus luciae TaxID=74702 RepID=A0ABU0AYD4_9FIRM|nr:hypothetical protein [Desulfofundulus luciae]MDQ0285476.1 hypothetical protein [Desulfofundulus luciae]